MVNLELKLNGRTIGKLDLDEEVLRQLLGVAAAQPPPRQRRPPTSRRPEAPR